PLRGRRSVPAQPGGGDGTVAARHPAVAPGGQGRGALASGRGRKLRQPLAILPKLGRDHSARAAWVGADASAAGRAPPRTTARAPPGRRAQAAAAAVKVLILSVFHPELVRGGAQQIAWELFQGLKTVPGVTPVLLASTDRSLPALYKAGACITG